MYPFCTLLGTNSIPGLGDSRLLSNFGFSCRSAKPFALPSVPGNERAPAPLVHVAEAALAVKSYATPLDDETLISAQKALFIVEPMPKMVPEAFLSFQ